VALEEVYTSDAHYSSHVMSFHERHIDPDKVTWEVQTPFNPSGGRPVLLSDGTENTVGLDFEWVEFRLNDKDADGVYFDSRRQLYKPMEGTYADGKTMNVSGLVAYLKDQKRKFDAGLPNDFDNTAEEDGDCWIMKDTAGMDSADSTYEFVEDEEELEDMFRIFGELMSDAEIDFRN